MRVLSPILSRRLRNYWLAYWALALAETAVIAYLLRVWAGDDRVAFALIWFAFRIFIRPTRDQAIDLVGKRRLRSIPSLNLVGLLIAAALGTRVSFDIQQRANEEAEIINETVQVPLPARSKPPVAVTSTDPTAAKWLVQLRAFADQLDAEAGDLKRELPSGAQSLRAALDAAEQAVAAANAGDAEQSRAWQQKVSAQLKEFAEEARESPDLSAFADLANSLAQAYAEAAKRETYTAPF